MLQIYDYVCLEIILLQKVVAFFVLMICPVKIYLNLIPTHIHAALARKNSALSLAVPREEFFRTNGSAFVHLAWPGCNFFSSQRQLQSLGAQGINKHAVLQFQHFVTIR